MLVYLRYYQNQNKVAYYTHVMVTEHSIKEETTQ